MDLIVVGHPDPASFNHAIARRAAQTLKDMGRTVVWHDLHAEGFVSSVPAGELQRGAPLPEDIRQHCDELAAAELIVIVHPNWWGQPPAILKGWIDRVFRPDVAYRFLEGDGGEGVPVGLLKAKAAIVFNTANTARKREQAVFGDPLERIWKDCIFGLCGVRNFRRRMFETIVTSTAEQRRAWLDEVEGMVRSVVKE